jgi:IS30 family transposase
LKEFADAYRSRGTDRRGGIPEMQSLHIRPPAVADRLIPGHWEADLIRGAFNRSAVGTQVERTTRLMILARMPDASAASAVFTAALNKVAEPLRKTMKYDQGREMSRHRELTVQIGVTIYFCDSHSPWQFGGNENTNGLLRQYMPKGTDLSQLTQGNLDVITYQMST